MFCDANLDNLSPVKRQNHYDSHLSAIETLSSPRGSRQQPFNNKSSPTKHVSSPNMHSSHRGNFWYPSLESEPPHNYTPGLIPLLRKILSSSVEKGVTRRAVLCYERAVHIYRELWDLGWGCGYRNFMMACAALMDQHIQPAYSSLLGTPTLPGVRNLQALIEEAWEHGYDREGAQSLKGKLVGRRKWIGTAGMNVLESVRQIVDRCTRKICTSNLADFDVSNGNMTQLLDWVKRYFDIPTQNHPTTSVQEKWRAATPVVITDRMPLVLQHQGHSRTIVGYEITKDGATNLLAFDPSRRMAHIRDIALSSFNLSRGREVHLDNSKPSTSRRLVGSLEKLTPSRNKRLVADEPGPSSPKRMRAGSPGDDDIIIMEGPPEGNAPKAMPDRGKSIPGKCWDLLESTRKDLGRKKDKYQVLWFPMEDPLTESEKHARRVVISDRVC
ncbi:peptidase family C78-domain-containing protein [Lactifluus volemus]|nr:peptidase family C78-domain-containing protein [Lactifluus volemus]